MKIKFKKLPPCTIGNLLAVMEATLREAGFTWRTDLVDLNQFGGIKIYDVRKRISDPYCGNHPCSCALRPGPKRHRHGRWLEGGDWVRFNDIVNDVLDRAEVCADVGEVVNLRLGYYRRICYTAYEIDNGTGGFFEWSQYGQREHYACYAGRRRVPRSKGAEGTPGLPKRQQLHMPESIEPENITKRPKGIKFNELPSKPKRVRKPKPMQLTYVNYGNEEETFEQSDLVFSEWQDAH